MSNSAGGGGFYSLVIQFMLALTPVAAGWGGYLYTQQQDLAKELKRQEQGYKSIVKAAKHKDIAGLLRRVEALKKMQNRDQNKGLFAYVQFTANAEKHHVTIQQNKDRKPRGTDLIERSLQVNMPADLTMDQITSFLFKLQSWPEVKLKQLDLNKFNEQTETWGRCKIVLARYIRE